MDHREKIAAFARAHAPCSAHVNQALYIEAVVPAADRTPERLAYYVGPKPPSTCALFADQCLAGAGIDHPPIEGHYVVGTAIADLEKVDGGLALRLGTPTEVLKGDVLIIDDGSGKDAHVIVLTGDPSAIAEDGSFEIATVEGGQLPDSSGVQAFTRTLRPKDGRLYCGHRYVVARIDADALAIGDDVAGGAGEGARIPIPEGAHHDTVPPSEPPTDPPPAS